MNFDEKAKAVFNSMNDNEKPLTIMAGALDAEYRRGRYDIRVRKIAEAVTTFVIAVLAITWGAFSICESRDRREHAKETNAVLIKVIDNCKP